MGSGGCTDSHADCACDSTTPECVRAIASFCPIAAGCPPALEDARNPENWPPDAVFSAILTECDDGILRFEQSHFESGTSFAFDSDGRLVYEAGHASCNMPVCGAAPPLGGNCRSCRLAPVAAFPRAGEGGQAGAPPTLDLYPPCEVDETGSLSVPRE
jgi:hypothetical protein